MNKEKAIEMLKHCGAESHCYDYNHGKHCEGCNQRIAQDIAIEALKISAIPVEWIEKYAKQEGGLAQWLLRHVMIPKWQKEQRKEE